MTVSAASLKVKYALDHHAKPLKPLYLSLLVALAGSGKTHCWQHWREGANSNYIVVKEGTFPRFYYLRGVLKPEPVIEIRRGTVRGPALLKLTNERDCVRWVESL